MKNDYEIRGEVTAILLRRKDGSTLETLIDTDDLEKAKSFEHTWRAVWVEKIGTFYVHGSKVFVVDGKKRKTTLQLHRVVMDNPVGSDIDHINHNGLDNRSSENLRIASRSENVQNQKSTRSKINKSGYRGVYWIDHINKWHAQVNVNRKPVHFGYFTELSEAVKAVSDARSQLHPFSQEARMIKIAGGGLHGY